MKIVLDTNVLVSALLTPMGASSVAVKTIFEYGEIYYDLRILTEYRKVLNRKEFGFDKEKVKYVLDFIENSGMRILKVLPLPKSELSDPNDMPFLEVAVTCKVDFLITGNKQHFPENLTGGVEVLSPGGFLKKINFEGK